MCSLSQMQHYYMEDFILVFCNMTIAGEPTIAAPETSSSINTGAFIGGTIAGVATLLISIFACFIYCRKRRKPSTIHMRYLLRYAHVQK